MCVRANFHATIRCPRSCRLTTHHRRHSFTNLRLGGEARGGCTACAAATADSGRYAPCLGELGDAHPGDALGVQQLLPCLHHPKLHHLLVVTARLGRLRRQNALFFGGGGLGSDASQVGVTHVRVRVRQPEVEQQLSQRLMIA